MWEYNKTLILYNKREDLNKQLNELGEENWEIIFYNEIPKENFDNYFQVEVLLKRPKK